MKLGIVGLPNVGKSTLFNSMTLGKAEAANYPFCTIDPNVGVVPVPDERLARLTEMYDSAKTTPAVIEFVDIAGLVRGASKGEGLGNKFLSISARWMPSVMLSAALRTQTLSMWTALSTPSVILKPSIWS
mgnify:CR=1 FL=1